MISPKRLVDDPSMDAAARAFLRDAREETASPEMKARALVTLGLAAAVSTTSGAATAGTVSTTSAAGTAAATGAAAPNVAGAAAGAGLVAWKILIPLSAVLALAGGTTWMATRSTSARGVAISVPAPPATYSSPARLAPLTTAAPSTFATSLLPAAPSAQAVLSAREVSANAAPSLGLPSEPEPTHAPETAIRAGALTADKASTTRRVLPLRSANDVRAPAASSSISMAAPTAANASSRLAEEALALEAARTAVADGRGADALILLDGYEAQHLHGELQPEAMGLRVEALAAAGRSAAARDLGHAFLSKYPRHPAAARVLRIVEANR